MNDDKLSPLTVDQQQQAAMFDPDPLPVPEDQPAPTGQEPVSQPASAGSEPDNQPVKTDLEPVSEPTEVSEPSLRKEDVPTGWFDNQAAIDRLGFLGFDVPDRRVRSLCQHNSFECMSVLNDRNHPQYFIDPASVDAWAQTKDARRYQKSIQADPADEEGLTGQEPVSQPASAGSEPDNQPVKTDPEPVSEPAEESSAEALEGKALEVWLEKASPTELKYKIRSLTSETKWRDQLIQRYEGNFDGAFKEVAALGQTIGALEAENQHLNQKLKALGSGKGDNPQNGSNSNSVE